MQKENKRKFLVTDLSVLDGHKGFPIVQGYLSKKGTLVEVRTFGSFAFLTVHGAPNRFAGERFEYPIPLEDALVMLDRHCSSGLISKTRHLIPHGNEVLEIDVFDGKLAGLVIAEVAADFPSEALDPPPWLGPEVTGDPCFGDFALAHAEAPPNIEAAASALA